ncbi:MAG: hypothetical protein L0387_27515 [Acidobacteria bacterium]|nr:hypothetical protein [Acidobacteriota bacterium]MCI0724017.1 hypothetical protein [Acidobacteriota bacterium]
MFSWGLSAEGHGGSGAGGGGESFGTGEKAFQRQRKGEGAALLAKALVEQAGMTQREAAGVMGLTTGFCSGIIYINIYIKRKGGKRFLRHGLRSGY